MTNVDPTTPVPPEAASAGETAHTVAASPVGEPQPEPPVQQPPAEATESHPAASQQMAEGLVLIILASAVAVAAGVALLVPVRAAQVAAPATQATNDVE